MSNLTRWNPMHEMMTLRNAMDRLFESAFVSPQADWQSTIAWDLALDVSETDAEFLVKASLPGIKVDDLEITYNNNVLTIKGQTEEDKTVEEQRYHLRERRYGSFTRSISLPSSVKADAIEAQYDAGVLTLHLPKAEEARPRRIQVKPTGSQKVIEGRVADIKSKN